MGENTIDNLSIQVTLSAEEAAKVFDRLASSAGRVKGAASGAAGGLREAGDAAKKFGNTTAKAGETSEKVGKDIRGVGKDAKDAGDNAKKGASGIKTFWESLKRIAFYRFVRSIIKSITDGFKEGATNLYQWSKATGLSDFAKNMDRIATSALYLKNSLGAMLEPIIRVLTPIIETVVNGLVWIINHVNMLFAMLSGSQTYTVAKKVATTWGDAGKKAASSAKKAADDIKRTILGFDEINKLEKQNTSSGSTGSGTSDKGIDYSSMFETKQLPAWMATIASVIEKLNIGWAGVLAGILAGFEAIKASIKAVSALSLGWLKDMAGKTINVAVSLVRKGWTTIKNWALSFGQAVVDLAVTIKTKAVELWAKFAAAWTALSPVLKVGIAISVTAAVLWAAYQLAWALVPDKVLQVQAAIKTTAAELWQNFQTGWNNIKLRVLLFSVAMAQNAATLWASLKKSWDNIKSRIVMVSVAIQNTAKALWNGLVGAWNKVTGKVLSVSVKISTGAKSLWDGLVKEWNAIPNKVLSVGTKISTAVSTLWSWLKENWKIVAAGALGIAIAIATPWTALATALSGLWAEVMGSFGGALAFGVTPNVIDPYAGMNKEEKINAMGGGKLKVLDDGSLRAYGGGTSSGLGGVGRNSDMNANVSIKVDAIPGNGMKMTNGNLEIKPIADTKTNAWVKLLKLGWSTVMDWAYQSKGGDINQYIALAKQGWDTIDRWAAIYKGSKLDQLIGLARYGWSLISNWSGQYKGGIVNQLIGLVRNGWSYISGWSSQYQGGTVGQGITLERDGWYSVNSWAQNYTNGDVEQGVKLSIKNTNGFVNSIQKTLHSWFPTLFAKGGVITAGGAVSRFAHGGIIHAYAGGTSSAHGSLFLAGEAGPEIVGHVGGRTEVLNKSQIASAMYSAVQAAMAPASANFAAAANAMNADTTALDMEMFAEMVRQGVESAMERERDILRQQLDTLRQINAKDTTVEVTTSAINKAQTRMNRRAGVTIAPVGT